ncbi:hypothetical protein ABZ371_24795 [Streptomyces sp. NPDC005899]|uniref:hypothetical protein n=1 Tax=Streptomyces sp. NPDC005899 TaxID=3155716 RepID=UPI0033ED5FCE
MARSARAATGGTRIRPGAPPLAGPGHHRLGEFALAPPGSSSSSSSPKQAKRHVDDAQADLERRREIYVALNSGARRYRFRMMEDLYALRSGAAPDPATEVARVEFQDIYAQAQMLVPDNVLLPCQAVRVALAEARKLMEPLTGNGVHDQRQWQDAHTFLIRMWDPLTSMQRAMRQDLGISAPPHP